MYRISFTWCCITMQISYLRSVNIAGVLFEILAMNMVNDDTVLRTMDR